jgi:RND family efflux transporter MFP subunit
MARERAAAATLASARRQVEVARAELKRFEAMEADSRMTAPFAGVIARLDASPGDFVQGGPAPSGQARPLLRLVQLDRLRCAFAVSVGEIGAIHRGDPVEIRLGNRVVTGRVERIAGEVTASGRTMMVEADVANADRSIVPGSYATAVLAADVRTNALVLPVETLIRNVGGILVLKVTPDGKVESMTLRTGIETPNTIEILEGLNEGDLIITAGGGRIRPGQTVEARIVVVGNGTEGK